MNTRKEKIEFLKKLQTGEVQLSEISPETKNVLWVSEFIVYVRRDNSVNWDLPEKQAIYRAAVKKAQYNRLHNIHGQHIFLTDDSKLSDFL